METAANKRVIYKFGAFALDPNERTLYSDGMPIHLPAKEFETLLFLVENNGRALSKEEMISAIWQDAFVEEGNLAKQISKLRKIINSDGNQFIQTMPKHGYRFSAELHRSSGANGNAIISIPKEDGSGEPTDPEPVQNRSNQKLIGLLVVAVLVAGGFLGWKYLMNSGPQRIKSVAVLPLRSLNDDESGKMLGLGLTDTLITRLSSLKLFAVRPIRSVDSLSGDVDPIEIGRRLNVDAVLEGSIQQSEGRVRINARLLSTVNGEQIWAEKFDDAANNIFAVQDRMSEQAARALLASVESGGESRRTKRFTENAQAFDAYLKGRYYWNKRTEPDFRRAIGFFEQAVALDPNYALAWAGLADTYVLLAVWGTEPPSSSFGKAKDAALKALASDNDLAEAHTSLGFIKWVFDWDTSGADAEFETAIRIDANYATAHHWYSYYLVSNGRADEAIAEIKRAQELEGPLSLSIMTDVGEIYCWSGQYEKAVSHLRDVISIEPNYAIAHYILGISLLKVGSTNDAVVELERAHQLESSPRIISALSFAYAKAGRKDEAQKAIADLEDASRKSYVSPFSLAIAEVGIGNDEKAIDLLEKAFDERSDAMAILNIHPLLDSLHDNPRFKALTRKISVQ